MDPTRTRREFLEYPNGTIFQIPKNPIPERSDPNPKGYPNAQGYIDPHFQKKYVFFSGPDVNQYFRVDFGLVFRGSCKMPMRKRELHKIYTKFKIK